MISPKETYTLYHDLFRYLSDNVERQLVFMQRKTYAEVNALFTRKALDVGFVCAGPYARGGKAHDFELLATPEIQGSHSYQAYLIVGRESPFETLADLRGKSFAFTDPDSNTGHLVPLYWLHLMGTTPRDFFSSTIYTYSHDNSIMAVSKGLVDAASVDSLIWHFLEKTKPDMIRDVRIIQKSSLFGIPPLVASTALPDSFRKQLKNILLRMHENEEGRQILQKLMIDRFTEADDAWYDSIRDMTRLLDERHAPIAISQP